jgi:flagellar FliJ protein
MIKFDFGLQKVLQLRKFHEEESKIVLGQAIGVLTGIENNIKETAVKRHHAATELFSDASQMMAWRNYILRLDQMAEQLTEQAARAELVVEEKRALYLEASKELKAMEKLKEKREKEHRKEMFAYELAELDIHASFITQMKMENNP